jgi:hypothetical protein
MKRLVLLFAVLLLCVGRLPLAASDIATTAGTYETGFADVQRISADLHQALDAKLRPQFHPQLVLWEKIATPYAQPGLCSDGTNTWKTVHVSAGFVDLANHLAHAKALDSVERGFLKKYIVVLAGETGDRPLAPLECAHARAWTFDTMNLQASQFNQMVAGLLGIELAHHSLGHYSKYAGRLADSSGHPVPLASLVTLEEWRDAVLKGARAALDCGFSVDGLKTLFEAFEKMPARPAWAACFLPEKAPLSKLKRDLDHLEKGFFLGSK